MWKFLVGSARSPWLKSLSDHPGRETWEFDPNAGTLEDVEAIENLRANFVKKKHKKKHSSDEIMRYLVISSYLKGFHL